MPDSIKTPEDWWAVLDESWDDLRLTIGLYLDMEAVPDPERTGVSNPDGLPLGVMLKQWKEGRDHDSLLRVLNETWARAPDRPEIHQNPAWAELCDLCSEVWVFHEF